MNDESRVWVNARTTKRGRSWHLRWRDPVTGKRLSKYGGPTKRVAERAKFALEDEIAKGTYRKMRRSSWDEFVQDHVAKIKGVADARESKRTLIEFGDVIGPASPKSVTYAAIEQYVAYLRAQRKKTMDKPKNTQGTINKKLRYIRGALNMAVKRGFTAQNVSDPSLFAKEDERLVRVIDGDEERALFEAAETLYGFRFRAFLLVALNTGGRRSELLGLSWARVDFDAGEVCFDKTKSHRGRYVPIKGPVVDVLRRLKLQTLQDGGPFIGLEKNLQRRWDKLLVVAGVDHLTLHDLRRTFITRLIRAGVPLPTVQKLAGHSSITTTLRYYNAVSREDLHAGIEKLDRRVVG